MTKFIITLIAILFSNNLYATVYKVTKNDGSTHYADKAKHGTHKSIAITKEQKGARDILIKALLDQEPSSKTPAAKPPTQKIQLTKKELVDKTYDAKTPTTKTASPDSQVQKTLISSEKPSQNENKEKYAYIINETAHKHKVDVKLVHAVIQAESSYNATAKSSAGAVGLMQLTSTTAKKYGVSDRRNPDQNIDGGTRYLKDLLTLFKSDMRLAVAAYNAGENAVIKYNNKIPPYPETRNYVKTVLAFYSQ